MNRIQELENEIEGLRAEVELLQDNLDRVCPPIDGYEYEYEHRIANVGEFYLSAFTDNVFEADEYSPAKVMILRKV